MVIEAPMTGSQLVILIELETFSNCDLAIHSLEIESKMVKIAFVRNKAQRNRQGACCCPAGYLEYGRVRILQF